MASEIQDFPRFGVDEQTYHREKSLRLGQNDIKLLGKYVLRHLCTPHDKLFAIDFAVQATEIKHAIGYKVVMLDVPGREKNVVYKLISTFNHEGYVTRCTPNPIGDQNQIEDLAEAELGYLLRGVSKDPYDLALSNFVRSGKPEEDNVRSKELIKI
jgi:hypothetical protein